MKSFGARVVTGVHGTGADGATRFARQLDRSREIGRFPTGDRHAYYRDLLVRGQGAFTSAWVSDHLMKDDQPILGGWTTLGYLAAEFPGYAFGNTVLSQSYRNPALLAEMAATLQYLTEGRLTLGIGAGWRADEYAADDYPYPSAGTRVEQLGEAIDVIRAPWTESPATYEGRHHHVPDAYREPRPATPIPILVIPAFR